MDTYLLAWNPLKYKWGSLEDEINEARADGSPWVRWSVGNSRSVMAGDRLFLIRLGQSPRGIVGSGWAKSAPFAAPHWNPEKAAAGQVTNYVDVAFDALYEEPRLPIEQLKTAQVLQDYHWSTQMSGVHVPDEVALELESAWADAIGSRGLGFPDETTSGNEFAEGGATRVFVNRYERNAAARDACLRHYGRRCSVCEMSFGERYGSIAAQFIQVHHLPSSSQSCWQGRANTQAAGLQPVVSEPPHGGQKRTMSDPVASLYSG